MAGRILSIACDARGNGPDQGAKVGIVRRIAGPVQANAAVISLPRAVLILAENAPHLPLSGTFSQGGVSPLQESQATEMASTHFEKPGNLAMLFFPHFASR